jgi:hypothetical protein
MNLVWKNTRRYFEPIFSDMMQIFRLFNEIWETEFRKKMQSRMRHILYPHVSLGPSVRVCVCVSCSGPNVTVDLSVFCIREVPGSNPALNAD